MDMQKLINERHSVRSYKDDKIEGETLEKLTGFIEECNRDSGLNIQLVLNEPEAFNSGIAHYGKFQNVKNYLVLAGKKSKDLKEKAGYYGEKLVLFAQGLGLNTCWVALTYSKSKSKGHFKLESGEKVVCVIAIGYGTTQGLPHKNRSVDPLFKVNGSMPAWFREGVYAAMAAPTAVNQQKFRFTLLDNNKVKAEKTGGFYSDIDLGIVKYHFELGAGTENFTFL